MPGGIDHNPGMSGPDGQVAGLRMGHSPKFLDPCIEVGRGRVFIRETSALVERMDQMRAIGRVTGGMQRGTNNRQALTPSQRPEPSRLVLTALRQRGRNDYQAENQ